MSTKVVSVRNQAHFTELVNQRDVLTVIMFTAQWCRPCQEAYPEIRRMAAAFGGEVLIATVDADDHQDILQMCRVRAFPTFMIVYNAKQLDFVIGAALGELQEKLRKHLKDLREERDAAEK